MVRWRGWSPRAPAPATRSACANGAPSVARARARTIGRYSPLTFRGRRLKSSTRAMWRLNGWAGRPAAILALLLTAEPPKPLAAPGVLHQFSYDKLRFSGFQADVGRVGASTLIRD